jgi:hypothetical protein
MFEREKPEIICSGIWKEMKGKNSVLPGES